MVVRTIVFISQSAYHAQELVVTEKEQKVSFYSKKWCKLTIHEKEPVLEVAFILNNNAFPQQTLIR
jgi:hypothetical protein